MYLDLLLLLLLQIKFVPGRSDSDVADQDDMLPNFNDNYFHTLFYFLGNGEVQLCKET